MGKGVLFLLVIFLFLLTFVSAQCNDSDVNSLFPYGKNHYVKSRISGLSSGVYPLIAPEGTYLSGVEACSDENKLGEYYCQEDRLFVEEYECPNGCEDGACIFDTCIDTDEGKNYYVKGNTIGYQDDSHTTIMETSDACNTYLGGNQFTGDSYEGEGVVEHYCGDNDIVIAPYYECPNGCRDGACIETIECDFDGDCQVAYGEGYTCENGVCIETIECDFDGDCQVAYGEGYTCENGACILECIDSDGGKNYYVRGYGTGEDENGYYYDNVLEGCINVPFPQGDLVNESDYLAEFYCENNLLKFDIHTCPNGCEEGTCLEGNVTDIPEDDENYICQGCSFGDKCYPFGYRKSGEYCSDNLEFVTQLGKESVCDNNFECKSNVCVNDECVSGNLIQRIIEWFKRLFGIE